MGVKLQNISQLQIDLTPKDVFSSCFLRGTCALMWYCQAGVNRMGFFFQCLQVLHCWEFLVEVTVPVLSVLFTRLGKYQNFTALILSFVGHMVIFFISVNKQNLVDLSCSGITVHTLYCSVFMSQLFYIVVSGLNIQEWSEIKAQRCMHSLWSWENK